MKQILQDNSSGIVSVHEVPPPALQRGKLLVRNAASLISAGTEKVAVDTGKQSLLQRAKERPDLVKQVIDRAMSEGLASTYAAVKGKLGSQTALGYSSAGTVVGVGEDVSGFSIGDRVACAGAGYASHAEVVAVPQNLCVRLPDELSFEEGAFGSMVSYHNYETRAVPIAHAVHRLRRVDPLSQMMQTARAVGITFGD